MKIKSKIYKSEQGTLHLVGQGECVCFDPKIVKKSKYVDPHITIAIGDFRLHLDKSDFLKFCSKVVYNNNRCKEVPAPKNSEKKDGFNLL